MGILGQASAVGSSDTWYEIVLYLHILLAIIGFGTVFLNGVYATMAAKRSASDELAVSETVLSVSDIAQYFIYAVFVTGLIMGIAADEPLSLGDLWLSLSMLLFIVGVGLSHGVLKPSVKKYNAALAAAGDADRPTPEMEEAGQRTAMVGGVLYVIVVVILYLMVFKPGLV